VGATDVGARIPALPPHLAFLAFITASAAAWGALRGGILPGMAGTGALAVLSVLLLQFWPGFVQRFQVQPNELVPETPHIERAMTATREGFALGGLHDRVRLPYQVPGARLGGWPRSVFPASRCGPGRRWRRPSRRWRPASAYYRLRGVTFTRYPAPGSPRPPRWPGGPRDPARLHPGGDLAEPPPPRALRDGKGCGGRTRQPAESPGAHAHLARGPSPGIPRRPEVPQALRLERPQVHVGSTPQVYSVITPAPDAFRAPDGSPGRPGRGLSRGGARRIVLPAPAPSPGSSRT
jgi:hypothetical protein